MTNPSFATDQPAKVDLFRRKPFAEALAKSLCLKKDSYGLVVGIEGSWGSGKTSVINFIKTELEKNDAKPVIIEFNPWMISGSEALVEIMLTQLATAIGDVKHRSKKGLQTAEKIVQYAELLKFLKYVPTLSWAGNIAEDATAAAGTVAKELKEFLPELDLTKAKLEVEKKLSSLDKPIIVIIDDLDRLTYSEIRHLFQAIKSVADFPRVTYLLAYDLNQITTALDQEFGNGRGQSYIEKIVQISYPLPVLMPLQMLAYSSSKINDLFSRLDLNLRQYESKYFEQMLSLAVGLQKSPRDLVRLINRLVLVIPNTVSEINVCDIVVMEAISLKYPNLRTLLHQRPELFTGRFWVLDDHGTDLDWSQFLGDDKEIRRNEWLEQLPTEEVERKALTKAFKFLFPNLNGDKKIGDADLDELRISASDRLQRYFALTTLDDSVDAGEIHELLKMPHRLEVYLDFNDETISKQLADLDKYAGSAIVTDVQAIFEIFINKTNYLLKNLILTESLLECLSNIILKILRNTAEETESYFTKLIQDAPLCLSVALINESSSDLGLWNPDGVTSNQPLIADKQIVLDARNVWESRVRMEAKKETFIFNPNASDLFWTWWHLTQNKGEVLDSIKCFFNQPELIETTAERLLPLKGYRHLNDMALIWSREELISILLSNDVTAMQYKSLIDQLSSSEVVRWFEGRQ